MRKSILLIVFVILSISTSFAQEMSSNWPKTKIVCDGKLNDWETPLRMYETNLQFDITNDSSMLYFAIKTVDPALSLKFMNGGLKIWFNTTGKKKEVSSIALVRPIPSENINSIFDKGEKPDKDKMQQLFIADKKAIKISGFATIPDGLLELDNPQGIRAAVAFDAETNIVYEFALPLILL